VNYRHAYHAGNHADVFKHIVLARAFEHLKKKDKPFVFLDAHAGIGTYAIEGEEALKTLEWQSGLGRLYEMSGEVLALGGEAEELLRPWRAAVAAVNYPGRALTHYPGSPELARRMLRPQDRIVLNELHPADHRALAAYAAGDARIRVSAADANVAVKAHLPPPERRGLALIDPPYERADEAALAIKALRDGLRRFATGTFFLWYPVTGDGLAERIVGDAAALALPKAMMVELRVRESVPDGGLAGSGLVIVNPPWPLETELPILVPALCERLAQTADARWKVERLTAEPV
jgi:23S rRNA (adenine2030-N6)-methyltransferase